MATFKLGREAIHTVWDASLSPALSVQPGDTVVLDTLDASYGGVGRQVQAGELTLPEHLDADLRDVIVATTTSDRVGTSPPGPFRCEGASAQGHCRSRTYAAASSARVEIPNLANT